MNIKLNDLIWRSDIPTTKKIVALAIASFINDGNEAWPSEETLGTMTGLCRKSVSASVSWLAEHGYIRIRRAVSEQTQFSHNVYTFIFPHGNVVHMVDSPCVRGSIPMSTSFHSHEYDVLTIRPLNRPMNRPGADAPLPPPEGSL